MKSDRFTVSTDSYCVTDNLTGLMWVRSPDSVTRTWQQALDYANNLTLCGYTDWRLPDIKELQSLTDYSQSNPTLPAGPPFINVQLVHYWSSTSCTTYPKYAWVVNIWNGYVSGYYKSNSYYYVWPVRSGQ